MKMREVIGAAREASPLVNKGLDEIASKIDSFRQLVEDLSSVKSDAARDSLIAECSHMADSISGSLADTMAKWKAFDETLSGYRYRFRKAKSVPSDLPGQMVMFDCSVDPVSRECATENP